MNTEDMLK